MTPDVSTHTQPLVEDKHDGYSPGKSTIAPVTLNIKPDYFRGRCFGQMDQHINELKFEL